MSAQEVRQVMLDTAVKAVESIGLTVSLDHISMDAVILQAGVARSAAYRVWPQRSAFITDLLLEVARSSTVSHSAYDPESLRLVFEEIQTRKERLTDQEERRKALIEASRIGILRNFEALARDGAWQTDIALRATIMSYPTEQRQELMTALDESINGYIDTLADFYEKLSKVLGYDTLPGMNFRYLASSGSSIIEGMLLRSIGLMNPPKLDGSELGATFESDPFQTGDLRRWNAPSIAFTANLLALSIPAPHYEPGGVEAWLSQAESLVVALENEPRNRK